MAKNVRGLEKQHEHGAGEMARDTRPLGERLAIFLGDPFNGMCILGIGIAIILIIPALSDIITLLALGLFLFSITRHNVLPCKMPQISHALDYNDTYPGTNKPRLARGITFFGNEDKTNKEIWFSNDDMRTHTLIFGSTGSGKTEMLVSLAFNSLAQGSGFIYIDGKGDNSLYAKIFSMVRRMGREDDLLLINFMTGARDVIGPQSTRLSNTMNPFANGSSSMLSQLVISLMDSGSGGGDGDMWKGRAMQFVEALMKILVAMRDEGHLLIDANTIRQYFTLEKLEQIVCDKRFPISDTLAIPLEGLPSAIVEPLELYVTNLPGYNKAKKGNQAGEVREQHGFITMQLTRVFGSLADTYGHIVRTNLAEVDLKDVVLNRRILVVLLPALEKSPEELANLGKIIVASLKAMMAAGLGDQVEGDYRQVISRKPTNAPTPFVTILDEYGYYAVKGFAVVPAQARSLGFAAIFAGQDLPAFQKASKEEAASIGANTNIKICMKMEDPGETWEFFNKTAGQTYATSVSGFQTNPGGLTPDYRDTRQASIERRDRIVLQDLRDQREGEFTLFYRSEIVRANTFFANPKPVKRMQVNNYLCVDKPDQMTLIHDSNRIHRFTQVFQYPTFVMNPAPYNEDIAWLSQSISRHHMLKPFECSIAVVIDILEQELQKQREVQAQIEKESVQEFKDEVNAFTPVYLPEVALSFIDEAEREAFKAPLLLKGRTREALMYIERLTGRTESEALEVADNLINDIIKVTHYPPADVHLNKDPEGVIEAIQAFYRTLTHEDLAFSDDHIEEDED